MAGIVGSVTTGFQQFLFAVDNPYISIDVEGLTEDLFDPAAFDHPVGVAAAFKDGSLISPANNYAIAAGNIGGAYFYDFYYRIHVNPIRMDLGTVANAVVRDVAVWNGYPDLGAAMDSVDVLNGQGISVTGPLAPLVMAPLQELVYSIRITPNGPPEINAQVQFDFSNVDDPAPVIIIGNRAVVLPAIPEVPVVERWRWLTDVHTSFDGTEQRVGLLSVPRRSQVTRLLFDDEAQLREQYKTLLSAAGRLFVPYFQYTAITTAPAVAGDSVLAFDTSAVDLRDDDYVLLMDNENARLVQLDAVGTTTATTRAPLSFDVAKGTKVIAIFASILPNELNLQRPHVNNYGTMTLTSSATYPRSQHQRPGSAATFNTLAGYFILERHPLANDDIDHSFDTGQEILDAKTGLFDVATDWDFTRVESTFEFKARRVGPSNICTGMTGPQEMDYWRLFGDEMKGSLDSFLLSTYRPDQVLSVPVGDAASSMIFVGPSYVDNFWPAIPYHYLAITTASGIHYAEVTGASKNVDNDSAVSISPALPAGAGWADVQQVSYLLKQRIVGDLIELEHFALETLIKFRARTIKA